MKSKHLTVSEGTTYRRLEDVSGRPQLWLHSGVGFIAPDNSSDSFLASQPRSSPSGCARILAYGLITRTEYPEGPLRVEYHLTPVGEKLASVIEQLRALETELSRSQVRE